MNELIEKFKYYINLFNSKNITLSIWIPKFSNYSTVFSSYNIDFYSSKELLKILKLSNVLSSELEELFNFLDILYEFLFKYSDISLNNISNKISEFTCKYLGIKFVKPCIDISLRDMNFLISFCSTGIPSLLTDFIIEFNVNKENGNLINS